MSELHKFLFEGLPVRGMIVRLTDAWQEILARRASNTTTGAYPPPVAELLGEDLFVGVLRLPQRHARLRAQLFELGVVRQDDHDDEGNILLSV